MTGRVLRGFPANFSSRRQVPRGRIRVDPEDNLSQGLIGAYLPGLFAGRNLAPPGGADMTIGSANGTGTPKYNTTGDGPGWKVANDTDGLRVLAPSSFKTWTGMTQFWRGNATLSTASNNPSIIDIEYSDAESSPYTLAKIYVPSAGDIQTSWNTNGSNFSGTTIGFADGLQSIAATFKVNGNVKLFRNGAKQTSTSFGANGPTSTATSKICLTSGTYSGSRNLSAITNLALFYNRELSEGEIAELDANPYRIFRQVPAIYLGVAAPIMGQGSPFVDGAWSGFVDRKIAVGY